jgi:hypothetical protein
VIVNMHGRTTIKIEIVLGYEIRGNSPGRAAFRRQTGITLITFPDIAPCALFRKAMLLPSSQLKFYK